MADWKNYSIVSSHFHRGKVTHYLTAPTSIPASSMTSLLTASSNDSPGSTNPAKQEYIPVVISATMPVISERKLLTFRPRLLPAHQHLVTSRVHDTHDNDLGCVSRADEPIA